MKIFESYNFSEATDEVVAVISKLSDEAKQILKDRDNFKLDKKSLSYLFWKEDKKEFNTLDYGKKALILNSVIKELKKYNLIKYYKQIDYGKQGEYKRGQLIGYKPETTTLGSQVARQLSNI
jgi:hypothetical protein